MFLGSKFGMSPDFFLPPIVLDRAGVFTPDSGRDYWVTNANAQLVLPDFADQLITIRNKTGAALNFTTRSRPFDFGGTTGQIASNGVGQLIAASDRWLTTGIAFPTITQSFSYTGANQSFTVPSVLGARIRLSGVGAGGGGGAGVGGGGGAVYCILTIAASTNLATGQIAAGASLIIVVGQGGAYNGTATRFGGGGRGGGSDAGSAGGYTGFFLGSVAFANAIALAGGGGGSGNTAGRPGGAGGGTSGQVSAGDIPGGAGTQSAGGAAASGATGTAAGQLSGGATTAGGYAGGGGGYYGGGAGLGGSGGSGFLPAGAVSGSTLTAGAGQTAAAVTGISGAGAGGAVGGNGGNGAALIEVVAA